MGLMELFKGKQRNYTDRLKYMTENDIEQADNIMGIVNSNKENTIGKLMDEIYGCDKAYNGEQLGSPNRPNTRINIVHPNIEGQVADISLQKLGFLYKGQESMDEEFAEWARINSEWTFEHQHNVTQLQATFLRRMLKYGHAFFKVCYDESAFGGFGISRIEVPSVDRIFVDQKVINILDLHKAEYWVEYIQCSKSMAIDIYGEEKASNIQYGEKQNSNDLIFDISDFEDDDVTAWTLIQFWTRDKGHLRVREFTREGLMLFDSMKGYDRTENQKINEVDYSKSIYTKVDNRFPYFMCNCYEREGELRGFGDIKLIKDLQDMLNNLYDNIRVSTKPKRLLVDTRSDIVPEDLTDDSYDAIPYDGNLLNGAPPVNEIEVGTPNSEWWRMIGNIYDNVQRITRYNELMTGQGGGGKTATESAILQQQGSKSTSMKLNSYSNVLKEVALYCLGLDLQYKTGKKAMRLSDDSSEMEFVDYDLMKNIPVKVPIEKGERKKWKEKGYSNNLVPGLQLAEQNGKIITRDIMLDLKVSIGNKMPNSPAMFAQIVNQFASLQLLSEDGKPRPAIFWEEFRKILTEVYDLPLDTAEKVKEDLKEHEDKMELERQKANEMQIAQSQSVQQNGMSPIPQGSPASIQSENQRSNTGVMQGNMDFQAQQ